MATRKDRKLINREIQEYVQALKRHNISVKAVYLFGSYLTGRADEWSDIDIAVLTDEFIGDSIDFKFLLMKIARSVDADLEPHPYLTPEFNASHPFAAEVLRSGERVF